MSIMLIFIAMAIGLLIIKSNICLNNLLKLDTLKDEIAKDCSLKAGISYQIDDIYKQGSKILCSSSCKCNANSNQWPKDQSALMATDSLGYSVVTDCPIDFLSTYQKEKILPVITALEK